MRGYITEEKPKIEGKKILLTKIIIYFKLGKIVPFHIPRFFEYFEEDEMDSITSHHFFEACCLANNQGWRKFKNKIFKKLAEEKQEIHSFISQVLQEKEVVHYNLGIIEENLSLFINCWWHKLIASSRSVEILSGELKLSLQRKREILKEGERFLITRTPDFYGAFLTYLYQLDSEPYELVEDTLYIIWSVVALIIYEQNSCNVTKQLIDILGCGGE